MATRKRVITTQLVILRFRLGWLRWACGSFGERVVPFKETTKVLEESPSTQSVSNSGQIGSAASRTLVTVMLGNRVFFDEGKAGHTSWRWYSGSSVLHPWRCHRSDIVKEQKLNCCWARIVCKPRERYSNFWPCRMPDQCKKSTFNFCISPGKITNLYLPSGGLWLAWILLSGIWLHTVPPYDNMIAKIIVHGEAFR